MSEVSDAREDHSHAGFIGSGYYLIIPNRSSGLYDGSDACRRCGVNAVSEGEEGVRSHNRARHLQSFVCRFYAGNFGAVDSAHLAGANPDGLLILAVNNGIGFDKLSNGPGKHQVLNFGGIRLAFADHSQIRFADLVYVAVLNQQATIYPFVVLL